MPEDITDEKSTLFQVMGWVLSGNNPLPKAILSKFCDAATSFWRYNDVIIVSRVRSEHLDFKVLYQDTEPILHTMQRLAKWDANHIQV